MLKRALSAAVGIGIFLGVCFGGLLPFTIGATVIAILATWEWIAAYQHAQRVEAQAGDRLPMPGWLNAVNVLLVCAGIVFCPLVYLLQSHYKPQFPLPITKTTALLLVVPIIVFSLMTLRARFVRQTLGGARQWYGAVGMVYIGLLMSSLVWMRGLNLSYLAHGNGWTDKPVLSLLHIHVAPFGWAEAGAWRMLFVAICVWMTDTGAYFVGKSFGRHKIAPDLSPGKTVEGSIGGLATALLTGAVCGLFIHLPLKDGLAIGLIAGTVGQIGDLFESALKREIGIKDFGAVMPGHGGALDRFDSILFVTPIAFCYLHFLAGL